MTDLADRWGSLSPNVQRAVAWGAGIAALLGVAAVAVKTADPHRPAPSPQEKLVRNLLTDSDPRALGIEGLAVRLERLERHLDAVAQQAAKATATPPEAPPTDDVQEAQRRLEMNGLKAQIDDLRRQAAIAKPAPPAEPPTPARSPTRRQEPTPVAPPPAVPVAPPRAERPLDQLFVPPSSPVLPAPASGAARNPSRPMEIRVVSAPAQEGRGQAQSDDALFIPAGAILSGVLLNGLDAPTGQGARKDPTPALLRIKRDAILPNRFRADVRECFVIVGGFGDLGSERALLRSETLTCVRTDGGVIEVPLDAYAVGEDGKVGVRGRLVSKQGALLAKALQAGFLTSFAKVFTQVPSIPISTGGSQMQFQSMFTPQAAAAGAAGGRRRRYGSVGRLLHGDGRADLPGAGSRCGTSGAVDCEQGGVVAVGAVTRRPGSRRVLLDVAAETGLHGSARDLRDRHIREKVAPQRQVGQRIPDREDVERSQWCGGQWCPRTVVQTALSLDGALGFELLPGSGSRSA